MIKIILADDHPVIRKGLKNTFEECRDLRVVGQASDGNEIFKVLSRESADVLVLDLSLPNEHGIDVLQELRRKQQTIAALVYTMHAEQKFALRAFKAGARGYVTKDRPLEELVLAVRRIAAGESYLSDSLAQRLVRAIHSGEDELPHQNLSAREQAVLRLIAAGKGGKEIAQHLHLSPKTVATYRARGLKKMRMTRDAQVIQYFLRTEIQPSRFA